MRQLIQYIQEKLKVGSKSKVNNLKEPHIKDFETFFDNKKNNIFEIIDINKLKGDPIIGNCYKRIFDKETYLHEIISYIIPIYKVNENYYCLNLQFTEVDKIDRLNEQLNYIEISYNKGQTNKYNGIRLSHILSKNRLINYGENINFDFYMKIIIELYDLSIDLTPEEFLKEFEKIISNIIDNETTK